MHLTCKNTSITPDRNGSVKRPDKVSRSYDCHSQWSCIIVLSCANNSPVSTRDRKIKMKRNCPVRVLGLAPLPFTRADCKIMEFEWKQTLNNRWSQLCRHARLAKPGITVDGKCLRWQETYHDAPSPCKSEMQWNEVKSKPKTGSFTSLQMVHTYARLPRGFFGRCTARIKSIKVPTQRNDCLQWGKRYDLCAVVIRNFGGRCTMLGKNVPQDRQVSCQGGRGHHGSELQSSTVTGLAKPVKLSTWFPCRSRTWPTVPLKKYCKDLPREWPEESISSTATSAGPLPYS